MLVVKNWNITRKHLEDRRMHSTEHRVLQIAINYIVILRKLWENGGYPNCKSDLRSTKYKTQRYFENVGNHGR